MSFALANSTNKERKQLVFLYDWLQIARKPAHNLGRDIKTLFELISIPTSESEICLLEKMIDPEGIKKSLSKQDFLNCFVIEEECKKPREKQLVQAFKYVANDRETVTVKELRKYFSEEGIDKDTSELIIKQLDDYIMSNGELFDYKRFAASIY